MDDQDLKLLHGDSKDSEETMQLCRPVEQIRRVFGDNLGIIFVFLHKNICCGYSLESPGQEKHMLYPPTQ